MPGSDAAPTTDATPRPDGHARPCVFLDRDGTLTREAGYINHPDRLELLPGAAEALRRLNTAGVLAVLVTNQAGLARGYFTEEVLKATFDRLEALLAEHGAHLDAVYHAPYHPASTDPRWREDPDEMRKPGIGMIRLAQRELPIDMSRAYVIGDRIKDVEFAHNAGLPGLFVKTGYGLGEFTYQRAHWSTEPEGIFEDAVAAIDWVLADLRTKKV